MTTFKLVPRLVVADAKAALEFYRVALGATVLETYVDNTSDRVVHSAIEIGEATVHVIDENLDWANPAPTQLGGSPVLLHATVDDPDALAERMQAHGAEVVIPIDDRFYGQREGRIRDPFGHLWILSAPSETVDRDEIQRRLDAH